MIKVRIETEAEASEDIAELDPPKGIGLRFDEIEEMIDEVLFLRLLIAGDFFTLAFLV